MRFNNLKLSHKLILNLVLPLLGLAFLAGFVMNQQMQSWQTASNVEQLSALSNHAAAALQHLQRERGRSASFLGSAGSRFSQELQEQQTQTDQQISKLNQYLQDHDTQVFGQQFTDTWQNVLDELALLPQQRSQILALQISADQAIEFYSQLNAKLINATLTLTQIEASAQISNIAAAYTQALHASENAGTERAILSAVFSSKELSFDNLRAVLRLMAQQALHTKQFIERANAEQQLYIEQKLSQPVILQVEQAREQAIQSAN
ncbi:MAG: hypothetical protein GX782_09405, partial [Gammaproteobacteria bacterium]|nr:hypothetical protein [Gammaproteobacteria bacterium]